MAELAEGHAVADVVILASAPRDDVGGIDHGVTLALGAHMDENLFRWMQQSGSRNPLREALLCSCFLEQARTALEDQAAINAEAFSYSLELEKKAHLPLVKEALAADSYKPAARAQGFRRIVVTTYDHRCALCGVRIITPEGMGSKQSPPETSFNKKYVLN